MRHFHSTLFATAFLTATAPVAYADINVVTSIKPVHSLAASVMQGVATPTLLIAGAGSPHTYALKPSQAKTLQEADVIFWIGHDLEAFLEKPIEAIAANALSVELSQSHGLKKLAFREGGAFDSHDHDEHDEHGHDEHGHDEHDHDKHDEHGHDDHDHDKHDEHGHDDHDHDKHDEHGHDEHEGHDHGEFDPHFWLDPKNAIAMVAEIQEHLSKIDPANAATYQSNAANISSQLDTLIAEIDAELEPVKNQGYIVFHDAYQYFEHRFGMSAIGSVTVSPEVMPGAERISTLQAKVRELGAGCVFSEPQFEPKLAEVVTENTQAGKGVLDPLGAALENGPSLYFDLIRNMAKSLKDCLVKTS